MKVERSQSNGRSDESRRRPGPSNDPTALESLGNRVYKTYGARRELAKRLQSRGDYWNAALVIVALAAAVASIALLVNRLVLGQRGDVILAVLGVMTLVASLMVSARDYKARSKTAFSVYRDMQRLSTEIEAAVIAAGGENDADAWSAFDGRYQDLLDESENHSQSDYLRARPPIWVGSKEGERARWEVKYDIVGLPKFVARWISSIATMVATVLPLLLALSSLVLMIPIAIWVASG